MLLLTRSRAIMGSVVNRPVTTAVAVVVVALVIALNLTLIYLTWAGG